MIIEAKGVITQRPLAAQDELLARQASEVTRREAGKQTMLAKTPEEFQEIYARGDGFVVLEGEEIRGHAVISHPEPVVERYGPGNLFIRHTYEVGSVFGNGHSADAVVGVVESRRQILRRLRERRFVTERYIAVVRQDNVRSNRLFAEKIEGSRLMTPSEIPSVILEEPVGFDEHRYDLNVYDVTHVRRRNAVTSQRGI